MSDQPSFSLQHKLIKPINMVMRSLRNKLMLSHFAVIFVAMTISGFLMLSLVRDYFLRSLEQSLAAQAYLIAQTLIPNASTPASSTTTLSPAFNTMQQQQLGNLSVQVESKDVPQDPEPAPYLLESNLAYLSETSVGLSAALETRIRILDERGVVLVDSAGEADGTDLMQEPAIASALRGEVFAQIEPIAGEQWLFVAVPVSIDEKVAGAIYLGQHLRDVAAVLSDLRARLMISAAVAIPLSAIAGLALARTITHPVQSLTVAAGKISSGDFEYPIESSGEDELGRLSHAFVSMRERLKRVEKMRTQFVSDVSHELRTPLTAIKGLAETLRDGAVDDSNVRDRFMASIEVETDRLIRLVNDLLILTRADSQALHLRLQTVDLVELSKSTAEKLKPEAKAKDLELELNSEFQALKVWADPDRLEQVLFILLDNALKHTPPGGHIVIEGRRVEVDARGNARMLKPASKSEDFAFHEKLPRGNWAFLCVTDTGEGVPPKDLLHVFERFYRADQARSRDRGGSGLGLSIAKALIEAHGGLIWLESPPHQPCKEGAKGTSACCALRESMD